MDHCPTRWNGSLDTDRPRLVQLDQLGLEVAELKANYLEIKELIAVLEAMGSYGDAMTVVALLRQAVTVDAHLRTWEVNLTPDWLPAQVFTQSSTISAFSNPEEGSQGTTGFDVYRSIQIADSMNQYRVYRLICLQIIWSCHLTQDRDEILRRYGVQEQSWRGTLSDFHGVNYQIQKLVDQICNSVAFHLSDRTDTHLFEGSNTGQAAITVRSALSQGPTTQSTGIIPGETITVGSGYILGPLSFLAQTFSPRPGSNMEVPPLREGQLDWIQSRLSCVMEMDGAAGNLSTSGNDRIWRLQRSLWYAPGA